MPLFRLLLFMPLTLFMLFMLLMLLMFMSTGVLGRPRLLARLSAHLSHEIIGLFELWDNFIILHGKSLYHPAHLQPRRASLIILRACQRSRVRRQQS